MYVATRMSVAATAASWGLVPFLRLLVHSRGRVPTPVAEDHQQHALGQRREPASVLGEEAQWIEPGRLDWDCSVRPVRARDSDQGYHHEDGQREVLDADEHVLQPVGDLDAAVGTQATTAMNTTPSSTSRWRSSPSSSRSTDQCCWTASRPRRWCTRR